MDFNKWILRKRKETLELQSELDATTAKIAVFNIIETQTNHGWNEWVLRKI